MFSTVAKAPATSWKNVNTPEVDTYKKGMHLRTQEGKEEQSGGPTVNELHSSDGMKMLPIPTDIFIKETYP